MDISQQKKSLRQEMKQTMSKVSRRAERSEELLKTLVDRNVFENVQFVSLFISFQDEVETRFIAEYCWSESFVVCVPEFQRDVPGGAIVMREWVKDGELEEHASGLLHPKYGPLHRLEEMDLILVPGMAFTQDGKRIGRGKGFYDRLLSQSMAKSVGLCFREQLQESLPWEDHDQKVHQVVAC